MNLYCLPATGLNLNHLNSLIFSFESVVQIYIAWEPRVAHAQGTQCYFRRLPALERFYWET